METKYDLSKILPHDKPMILIDELVEVDTEKNFAKAKVKITEDKIFYDRVTEGISPLVGIEYMAQTIGCYAFYKNGASEPKIGLLLGSRAYKCSLEKFEKDKEYTITAQEIFSDNELVSFECFIYNDGKECAAATVNAYQSDSLDTAVL